MNKSAICAVAVCCTALLLTPLALGHNQLGVHERVGAVYCSGSISATRQDTDRLRVTLRCGQNVKSVEVTITPLVDAGYVRKFGQPIIRFWRHMRIGGKGGKDGTCRRRFDGDSAVACTASISQATWLRTVLSMRKGLGCRIGFRLKQSRPVDSAEPPSPPSFEVKVLYDGVARGC